MLIYRCPTTLKTLLLAFVINLRQQNNTPHMIGYAHLMDQKFNTQAGAEETTPLRPLQVMRIAPFIFGVEV